MRLFSQLSQLQRVRVELENFTYPFILKTCGLWPVFNTSRVEGVVVHSTIIKVGFDWNSCIMTFQGYGYIASGAFGVARQVFDDCERCGFLGFHYFWIDRIRCLVCPFSASSICRFSLHKC